MLHYTIKNKEGKYLHLARRGLILWEDKANVSQASFLRREIEERRAILEKNGFKELEIEEIDIYEKN